MKFILFSILSISISGFLVAGTGKQTTVDVVYPENNTRVYIGPKFGHGPMITPLKYGVDYTIFKITSGEYHMLSFSNNSVATPSNPVALPRPNHRFVIQTNDEEKYKQFVRAFEEEKITYHSKKRDNLFIIVSTKLPHMH
jgi:hypothetical protein